MSTGRLAAVAGSLAVVAVLGSCGGGPSAEDQVRDAVSEIQDDLAAGRLREVCARMAERPKLQIGSIGHGRKPTTCERDLRELVVGTTANTSDGGLPRARQPDVVGVRVAPDGETAVVELSLGRDAYRMPFVKSGGEWRLDDFLGAQGPPPAPLR